DTSVWGCYYGISSFRTSARKNPGSVAVFCSAFIGASAATANQYFDFVTVAPESSIKAEVTIEYVGGYNQIGPGAFGGIQYQWSINNGEFHQFDIDSGLSWENIVLTIANLALDVFGVAVPELGLIVTYFQTLQNVGEIAGWFAQEIDNGNAKRYTAKFSFTVDKPGQHRLGVGVRANSAGAMTGSAYGTVVGYIPSVKLTISYPNYYGIPDFAIEDITLNQSPRVDTPLKLNLGVCNVGDGISDLNKTKFELFYTGGPVGQLVLEKNFGSYDEFKPGTTCNFSTTYTFTKRGLYLMRAKADPDLEWPEPDEQNNNMDKYIYVKGHPPNKPQKPYGFPAGKTLQRNKTYRIYSSGTDPDNDPLMYLFRVRSADGTFEYFPAADYSEYEGWTHNDSVIITPTLANGLGKRGVYYISVQTIDTDGLLSPWSQEEVFQVWDNTPPSRPDISGLCAVYTNTYYSFTASSSDAESDRIGYRFNWGDGSPLSDWYWGTDEVTSVTRTHKYTTPGTYTLQVQARDENGSESPWGTHTVRATVYVPPPGTIEVKSNNPSASFSIYRYDELKYPGYGT
ncbi:MAG: PKD domain-containing protein, partial [Candidatus Sumerlaeia bacterium]|nr:PKD domain-containing protein [Candidatus Sumerlaeia bacterium]